ncbi:hypothetical protein LXL04_012282 [Taraxacum kok-saghyz]
MIFFVKNPKGAFFLLTILLLVFSSYALSLPRGRPKPTWTLPPLRTARKLADDKNPRWKEFFKFVLEIIAAVFLLRTVLRIKAAEGARIAGASRIIGVDLNANRFELARKFGVTEFVKPKDYEKPVQEVIAEMTNGGVDRSVECTGHIDAMISAFECVHDELELEKFITHEVPFSEINKAFDLMLRGEGLRALFHHQDTSIPRSIPHHLHRQMASLWRAVMGESPPNPDDYDGVQYWLNPERTGWLTKQGEYIKTWRRRWFVLKQGKVFWFKESIVNRGSRPRGVIPVAECLTVKGAEDVINKQFAFELSTRSDTMYFIADSEKEKEDWINSIGRSIVQLSRSVTDKEIVDYDSNR